MKEGGDEQTHNVKTDLVGKKLLMRAINELLPSDVAFSDEGARPSRMLARTHAAHGGGVAEVAHSSCTICLGESNNSSARATILSQKQLILLRFCGHV
eukprot:304588-Pyramimonas_sp.AAC.4